MSSYPENFAYQIRGEIHAYEDIYLCMEKIMQAIKEGVAIDDLVSALTSTLPHTEESDIKYDVLCDLLDYMTGWYSYSPKDSKEQLFASFCEQVR